jgi:hypothetical protein
LKLRVYLLLMTLSKSEKQQIEREEYRKIVSEKLRNELHTDGSSDENQQSKNLDAPVVNSNKPPMLSITMKVIFPVFLQPFLWLFGRPRVEIGGEIYKPTLLQKISPFSFDGHESLSYGGQMFRGGKLFKQGWGTTNIPCSEGVNLVKIYFRYLPIFWWKMGIKLIKIDLEPGEIRHIDYRCIIFFIPITYFKKIDGHKITLRGDRKKPGIPHIKYEFEDGKIFFTREVAESKMLDAKSPARKNSKNISLSNQEKCSWIVVAMHRLGWLIRCLVLLIPFCLIKMLSFFIHLKHKS